MKIAHIIPGSGGSFYCGNCMRDSKYIRALKDLGHQVIKVPLYLPLFEDAHDLDEVPVFYGAVNLYLKQQFPIFRHMPMFIEHALDSKSVLEMAARKAGSTRAKGLEEMTISMLLGEDGGQKEELERLVDWLADEAKPDVVHLSNALLLGLAHRIKERMNIPVICSLQDEDVWVDAMDDHYRQKVWDIMSERGKDVDVFIPVSHFFSAEIHKRMLIPETKMVPVHIGVDTADYSPKNILDKEPVIGYLSRMCEENGLAVLVDAFILLRKNPEYSAVKLKITGGKTGDDIHFIREQKHKISKAGLEVSVFWVEEFEGEERQNFFDSVRLISVPVLNGEAFGLYMLEAMASGIPMVQPALGAFQEVIETSGGGVVYAENKPEQLAEALASLILNDEKLQELSIAGIDGVKAHFDIHAQAKKMVKVYESAFKSS
ncbi:MAG TPA: glycosyltransferase family 4 protein [Prolixibacteraceae bacterium]|nr:glycosyltransferase family 4 protein [Prolixibacteraceae bacterium]